MRLKVSCQERLGSMAKIVTVEVPYQLVAEQLMSTILEEVVKRVAHIIARDFIRKKKTSLQMLFNQEWVERRIRRAIREAAHHHG